MHYDLTVERFAKLFGTTVDDLFEDCKESIAKYNFMYEILTGARRDHVLLDVLKKIDLGGQTIAGKDKQPVWEKGWSENLQNFVEKNYEIEELIPKYYRPGQVLRIDRHFVKTIDHDFEFNFFKIFRSWIFRKYLNDVESIYEFGCGPGHNLIELAKIYPEKEIHGLDWTIASRDLVNKIADKFHYNITGHLFDMFSPDDTLKLEKNSVVVTIGALEQLGNNYELFLEYLLKSSPLFCIHIEPFCELYDENHLLDYTAIMHHKKRNLLGNYLNSLKQLDDDGKIEIDKIHRMLFGSLFEEGWSYVIWNPIHS